MVKHRTKSSLRSLSYLKNWAGEPLDSYQKILNFLRTTKTQTGLVVTAYLDRAQYQTGTAVDADLIRQLRLTPSRPSQT